MDPRLQALVAEQRYESAAQLAEDLGQLAEASRLWEQACAYEQAARCALEAEDASRALVLAARVEATALEDRAIAQLAAGDPQLDTITSSLRRLGRPFTAARLCLACGRPDAAARDLEAAGRLLDAAAAHTRADAPREAARCLEALLRVEPQHHAARLELGRLLLRHQRIEPAVRTLQTIPESAPERAAALPLLHDALCGLGLSEAARGIASEMQERGVAPRGTPSPPSAAGPEQILFGRFTVESEVARTPTAQVLKAHDQVTGESVAIKIFSARALRDVGRDARRRFEQEARVLGELQHPGIVPLRAYYPEGPALVLPWMAGGDLADVLSAAPISPARAAEIVSTVLGALVEAHRRGFLHRDIKPANVLFNDTGAPFLADFGTAHVSDTANTVTTGVIGTLAYMAPEQRAGSPANLASDVYSAGALFWHALTGAPPGVTDQFLSDKITEEQARIARQLVAPEPERPADTRTARTLVASVQWPAEPPQRSLPDPASARPSPAVESLRLLPRGGPLHHDRLLGRDVYVIEADAALLERARSFARANQPRLATILCHRGDSHQLWVEALTGPRPTLDSSAIEGLRTALQALHRAGGWHGSVDAEHLATRGGEAALRFPLAPRSGSAEEDLAALERLAV